MEKLMIRNFVDTDAAALEQVIRETWNYDRFSPPQTAQRLARVYLYSCLLRQSFVRVAVMGGKPVGVIMGRDLRKKASGGFTWKAIGAQLSMLVHREDRRCSKYSPASTRWTSSCWKITEENTMVSFAFCGRQQMPRSRNRQTAV